MFPTFLELIELVERHIKKISVSHKCNYKLWKAELRKHCRERILSGILVKRDELKNSF